MTMYMYWMCIAIALHLYGSAEKEKTCVLKSSIKILKSLSANLP